MENKITKEIATFESIKRVDDNGQEYWLARELMPVLQYGYWENFHKVIKKAIVACENSSMPTKDCFRDATKSIISGKATTNNILDYELNRYACYLIAQNGDNRKKAIALAQTYFAIQTRKQEISEQDYNSLSEDDKRIYNRIQTKNQNRYLMEVAKKSGVSNFGKFNNAGYKGLYNETAKQIKDRKGLMGSKNILDYMGSEELGANLFRITQTHAKLVKDNVDNESTACTTHNIVGKEVRTAIEKIGGTMPEKLPTPDKSIPQLEKEKKKTLRLKPNEE